MISLKQIQLLSEKVDKAVSLISLLKEENRTLKNTLEKSQKRIREFEDLINAFKDDQSEIEQTVLNAIKKLDALEEEVAERADRTGQSGGGEPEAEDRDAGEPDPADRNPDEEEKATDADAGVEEETAGTDADAGVEENDERQLDIF